MARCTAIQFGPMDGKPNYSLWTANHFDNFCMDAIKYWKILLKNDSIHRKAVSNRAGLSTAEIRTDFAQPDSIL